jgi:chromosome segregation ATPase
MKTTKWIALTSLSLAAAGSLAAAEPAAGDKAPPAAMVSDIKLRMEDIRKQLNDERRQQQEAQSVLKQQIEKLNADNESLRAAARKQEEAQSALLRQAEQEKQALQAQVAQLNQKLDTARAEAAAHQKALGVAETARKQDVQKLQEEIKRSQSLADQRVREQQDLMRQALQRADAEADKHRSAEARARDEAKLLERELESIRQTLDIITTTFAGAPAARPPQSALAGQDKGKSRNRSN